MTAYGRDAGELAAAGRGCIPIHPDEGRIAAVLHWGPSTLGHPLCRLGVY